MKNIVFIVNSYHPSYSAIGTCIHNVIGEMSSKYNIIVIAKKNENSNVNQYYECTHIQYINTMDNYIRNLLSERIKLAKGLKLKILKMAKFVIKGYGFISAILKRTNIKKQEVQAIYRALRKIDGEIEVIIPTCLPFESLIASVEYKKKISGETKVIPFLFDKYSVNSTLHRTENNKKRKFQRHLLIEESTFEKCDKLIFVDSWRKHLNTYFQKYSNKFIRVEHPLIKQIETNYNLSYDTNLINVVYTGALYRKLRSPLKMLEVFENLITKDNGIVMHFYVTGDCDSIIQDYSRKYPQNIIYYGKVKSDIAKSAIINGDILLSIGNTDVTQLPSKIFEYISTGNPVIHFYSKKEDPVIKILERYKNALCVWNNDKNIEANIFGMVDNQ
ncbi:MAG: hypothetical protein AAGU01_01490, partial [Clostridiaceae bacterium]